MATAHASKHSLTSSESAAVALKPTQEKRRLLLSRGGRAALHSRSANPSHGAAYASATAAAAVAATASRTDRLHNDAACNMTCRGVHFAGMGGALGRMACGREVPLELSSRSHVHFWRNRSVASTARHEGVCTKASGSRWHILTFGSHGAHLFKAKNYICAPARKIGADTCRAANLTDVEQASSREWMAAHGVNLTMRGIGYWRWKPLLIQAALRRLPRGDVLMWMDRDLRIFNRPLDMLFCIGQNVRKGVAGFHFPCFTERKWTKRELVDAMGADEAMLETVQLYAGLLVLRKTRFAVRRARVPIWYSNRRWCGSARNAHVPCPRVVRVAGGVRRGVAPMDARAQRRLQLRRARSDAAAPWLHGASARPVDPLVTREAQARQDVSDPVRVRENGLLNLHVTEVWCASRLLGYTHIFPHTREP